MSPYYPPVMISEEQIQNRVAELGEEITRDYADVDELVIVGILKGSFLFMADLARRVSVPRIMEFMALSAYKGTQRDGAVRMIMDMRLDIQDRHVLIVEDIIDTGDTLTYLLENLQARHPASLASCALVKKERENPLDIDVEYVGFEIPDVWAVGYGLDYRERFRALSYIGHMDPEAVDF